MSPAKFHEEDRSRVVLNGPRPSPLRIGKDSHVIQKPSSSHQMKSINISSQVKATKQQQQQQQRQPVIIYTHSPKIIHTKPRDFMALVQKLTGFSRTDETKIEGADIIDHQSDQEKRQTNFYDEKEYGKLISHEDNDSSSVTSDEKCEGDNNKGVKPYMAEIPLFTPNSSNLLFSPQGLSRNYPDAVAPSPGIVGSLSPSFLEFLNMKELPEY